MDLDLVIMKDAALAQTCVSPNFGDQKLQRIRIDLFSFDNFIIDIIQLCTILYSNFRSL